MTNPSVSVVIPHFNAPETLRRALASVKSQTYPVHEVIVVDDASTESNRRSAEEVVRLSGIGTWFSFEENVGPASARNYGWRMASGDWVAFLDADDVWHPQKLELQTQAIGSDTVLIGGPQIRVQEGWMETDMRPRMSRQRVFLRHLCIRNQFATSSVLVSRKLSVRFLERERYCEDYELWIRIASGAGECLRVPSPLSGQFKHSVGENGLSSHVREMAYAEFEVFLRLRRERILNTGQFVVATGVWSVRLLRRAWLLLMRRVMGSRLPI